MTDKVEIVYEYNLNGTDYLETYALDRKELLALKKVEDLINYHTTLGETYCDDSINDGLWDIWLNILRESELVSVKEV